MFTLCSLLSSGQFVGRFLGSVQKGVRAEAAEEQRSQRSKGRKAIACCRRQFRTSLFCIGLGAEFVRGFAQKLLLCDLCSSAASARTTFLLLTLVSPPNRLSTSNPSPSRLRAARLQVRYFAGPRQIHMGSTHTGAAAGKVLLEGWPHGSSFSEVKPEGNTYGGSCRLHAAID